MISEPAVDQELETILKMAFVAEFRDPDSANHLLRVSRVSRLLGEELGLDSQTVRLLELAAPMHDIGKVSIPDNILLKPAALTADERVTMQPHTVVGARLLADADSPVLRLGEQIARTHHERWDGTGYPNGLSGEQIPLAGRIVGLADVYDALVTRRVYKAAVSPERAAQILYEDRGKHFDPDVVDAFFAIEDEIRRVYDELDEDEGQWLI
ncbi:MAG: HD domain-containing protein [Rubrivivax sp.]|nr:HD domain-containing protein [Rubrivivax sp.]